VGYHRQGSNPYIPERVLSLYFHAFVLPGRAVTAAVYKPEETAEAGWRKVASYSGPVSDLGDASFHLLQRPRGDRLCLIYGREIAPDLLRAQYALYDLHAGGDDISAELIDAGVVGDRSGGCDAVIGGTVDATPLEAVADHERLLATFKEGGYGLPGAVKPGAEGGIRVTSSSLGRGAGGGPMPGARLSVFGRAAIDKGEWQPHAHFAARRESGRLNGFAPPFVLVCVQTPLFGPPAQIMTCLIVKRSSTGRYETFFEGGPVLSREARPCDRFNTAGLPFVIDEFNRPAPASLMLPEGTGLRAGGGVALGELYPGQDWPTAVEAARALLGTNVSEVPPERIAVLSEPRQGEPLPVIMQGIAPTDALWLRAGDGTDRFVVLIRRGEAVETVVYSYRPENAQWRADWRALDYPAWSGRLKAAFGTGGDVFGYGTGASVQSAALWMWPAQPESCDQYGMPRPKPGAMLSPELRFCITAAGAAYKQLGGAPRYVTWSTTRQRLPW